MTRIIALLTCAAAAAPSAMLAAASAGSLRGPQGGEEATTVTRHRPSASDTVLAPAEGEEGYQHSIEDNLVQETTPELVSAKDLEAAVEMNSVDYDQGDFPYDGTTFTGDGTYYGETSNGNCAIRSPIPSIYDGMIPVALNNAQYGDSEMCGACIEGEGSGNGAGANPISGSFKAYVMDKCPECAYGDLDFSKSGDGRWDISWKFVPCSGGSDKPSFIFEGSHEYYWKIQPRGTKTPVEELKVAGASGTKTDDNFFEIWGAPYPLYGPQTVETKTMFGVTATQEVSLGGY